MVGAAHAHEGATFTYLGETDAACATCRLRRACQNLKPHRAYRVRGVRPVEHRDVCGVFAGPVRVVEVEEAPVRVAIPAAATKGTGWANRFEECGARCLLKRLCDPAALPRGSGATGTLLEVGGRVPCLVGRDLRFATVRLA